MSPKYFNLILFYIFTTSCIIIVSGLNVEGVGSNDESKENKSRKDKGKIPSENTQNPAEILKKFDKTRIEKERQNGSSSSSTRVKTVEVPSYTTAEVALITALENACKDFKIGDLLNVGSVCRSWNEIAQRENSNRGLEGALLPSIFSTEISNTNSDFHVWNVLNTLPSVAILFLCSTISPRPPIWENVEERTLAAYRRFFPQHLVIVNVDVSMIDKNVIYSMPDLLHPATGILGLFMPLHKDIQIKVSSCSISEYDPARCHRKIINDLTLDSKKKHSTIIIFCNSYGAHFIRYLVYFIKSSFEHKSYSLWGAVHTSRIIYSKSKDDISGENSFIFALNLSGENLKSWSIFFDSDKKEHKIIEKLLNFKNSLKLQEHTIGLVCGPEPESNDKLTKKHLMDLVKQIFPNIPFIGVFNSYTSKQIGVNSLSDDSDQRLLDKNFLSLMIITHN